MRLNPFDTSKIKVRSSSGGSGGSRVGRAGGIGCGTLVVALVAALAFGVDPAQTIALLDGAQQGQGAPQADTGELTEQQICTSGPFAREACDALTSLNETWEPAFAAARVPFEQPTLNLFPSGRVDTNGCGSASSANGPFYCPADRTIYIDVQFFDQLAQMAGTRGDFARLYVIAHEYGHHIQNLTGTASEVRRLQGRNPQQANRLQVSMELQADCYAGVWAGKNRDRIERGDLEEGMRAASSVGDDTLMARAGRGINPESFTHGTSEQRMDALHRGLESANSGVCDGYFDFR
ncbi:MAG: neutral zinc metallopeptidase [Erythrobacter sp.]|nr:neutral zinc metallopeptidase [Erythrobacter sp.]